jgi:hypothetical protein
MIVWVPILPVPDGVTPVAPFAAAVQENVAPGVVLLSVTAVVVLPEQIVSAVGLKLTFGAGLTVIVYDTLDPAQAPLPPVNGVME